MKQRLEASVNAEDSLQQQVVAQQRQVDDANTHCEALQKARQEAEEELQVGVLSCNVLEGVSLQQQALGCNMGNSKLSCIRKQYTVDAHAVMHHNLLSNNSCRAF